MRWWPNPQRTDVMSTRVSHREGAPENPFGDLAEWTIASDIQAIDHVVDGVISFCASAGFSARHRRFNVPIALTEALSNAILRGNQNDKSRRVHITSSVRITPENATLLIDVTDEGEGFDVDNAGASPDSPDWLDREDGRGVFLMRSLMDRVECGPAAGDCGYTVRLILYRT